MIVQWFCLVTYFAVNGFKAVGTALAGTGCGDSMLQTNKLYV